MLRDPALSGQEREPVSQEKGCGHAHQLRVGVHLHQL